MRNFDFAITVALGSIIASTVLSKSISLWDDIVGLALLYFLQLLTTYFQRYSVVTAVTDNSPLFLMTGEIILHKNLKKTRVTEFDFRAKLCEVNMLDFFKYVLWFLRQVGYSGTSYQGYRTRTRKFASKRSSR